MRSAWEYCRDSPIPDVAYVQTIFFIWGLGSWLSIPCRVLTEVITYVAEAVAKYSWPAKWPFLAMAADAAEASGCKLPDAVAEALGPDEYKMLVAFLQEESRS